MKANRICIYYFRAGTQKACNIFKNVDLQKDYYKVLEIQNIACENSIKRSYLRLVKQLHPDYNPSGHDRFTEVQQAYQVLSNRKFKTYYDENNEFYQKHPQKKEQFTTNKDNRNEQFYNKMKGDYYSNFQEKQQPFSQDKETEQQAKLRQKFQDEIKLTRKILFTRNPLWERANAFMNYEQRQRRVQEKQKQLQTLFPSSAKIANKFKQWIS